MRPEELEQLLYEEESPTLDFKRDQYAFAKASDEEKSELLKDILGFANCWRRADAVILIGVEEVQGGRSLVHGITEHLQDHSLQQFVNNLTNRPVQFRYEACEIEGKRVGVIRIEQQKRPVYLKKDYGKLQKEKVYIRRGSSTDPSKPAGLDEIALMGQPVGVEESELTVLFADLQAEQVVGDTIALEAEFCEMPRRIPSLSQPRRSPLDIGANFDRVNENLLREMAEFVFVRRLYRPVRLVVHNIGRVVANNVRIELCASKGQQIGILSRAKLPDRPYRDHFRSLTSGINPRHLSQKHPGEVHVEENSDAFRVFVECGSLQPGRRVWTDEFFVARRDSGQITLEVDVLAENLSRPKHSTLMISIDVTQTAMSVEELARQSDAGQIDD